MGMIKRAFGLEPPVSRERNFAEMVNSAERAINPFYDSSWHSSQVNTNGTLVSNSGRNALRLSVVYACVNLISSKIAQLPVKFWEVDPKTGEHIGQRELPSWVRTPDPSYGVLGMSWMDTISQAVVSLLLSGNAYLAYSCSRPGVVKELKVLDPSVVDIQVLSNNKITLRVGGQVPDYSVIPIRYLVPPGDLLGISPIKACHRSLTVAEGAQEQTATFFTQGSTLPGQIILNKEVTEEELKRHYNNWNRMHAGVGKSHLPLMLQNAEYKPMSVTPEDAQALTTWQWSDARVAAQIFGVNPARLAIPMHSDNKTYANIGASNRAFYDDTLMPIVRRLEQAFDWLCPKNGTAVLRFDNSEFVADEARVRHHIYVNAIKTGYMTINEVRAQEGLPPLDEEPNEEPNGEEPEQPDDTVLTDE